MISLSVAGEAEEKLDRLCARLNGDAAAVFGRALVLLDVAITEGDRGRALCLMPAGAVRAVPVATQITGIADPEGG